MSYCTYVRDNPADAMNKHYHDTQYGFPLVDDDALFERLILEINQAGLSWGLILKRMENFHKAYDGFNIDKVAAYTEIDRIRLLGDVGIIRNHLKINAAIENACRIYRIRQQSGSFKNWLDENRCLSLEEWTRLFKQTFVFTGKEIVKEFLLSTSYLPGAHDSDCPIYLTLSKLDLPWMRLASHH